MEFIRRCYFMGGWVNSGDLFLFITIFYFMQGIPIVVSRLTSSGKKQVYTVRDSISDHDHIKNCPHQNPDFSTVDHCKLKQKKVRIRRIQSSGSKRRFPRDFFNRQGIKPQRNVTLRDNNDIQHQPHYQQQTGYFVTINQPNPVDEGEVLDTLQTPKFRGKNETVRISSLYKNRTLKESINKIVGKKEKKQNAQEPQPAFKVTMNSLENTFSGNQFKSMKNEPVLDLRAVMQPNKQNLPIKRIKVSKENFLKKFPSLKQKQNLLKNKNTKQ